MNQTSHMGELMANGRIGFEEQELATAEIPWVDHTAFAGVRLKHLIAGAATEGRLSCHLVRLEPGCSLATHVHDGQWELHEVVQGSGRARLPGKEIDYLPGVACVIPQGTPHQVRAGEEGLWLLAKFFPALI